MTKATLLLAFVMLSCLPANAHSFQNDIIPPALTAITNDKNERERPKYFNLSLPIRVNSALVINPSIHVQSAALAMVFEDQIPAGKPVSLLCGGGLSVTVFF